MSLGQRATNAAQDAAAVAAEQRRQANRNAAIKAAEQFFGRPDRQNETKIDSPPVYVETLDGQHHAKTRDGFGIYTVFHEVDRFQVDDIVLARVYSGGSHRWCVETRCPIDARTSYTPLMGPSVEAIGKALVKPSDCWGCQAGGRCPSCKRPYDRP